MSAEKLVEVVVELVVDVGVPQGAKKKNPSTAKAEEDQMPTRSGECQQRVWYRNGIRDPS